MDSNSLFGKIDSPDLYWYLEPDEKSEIYDCLNIKQNPLLDYFDCAVNVPDSTSKNDKFYYKRFLCQSKKDDKTVEPYYSTPDFDSSGLNDPYFASLDDSYDMKKILHDNSDDHSIHGLLTDIDRLTSSLPIEANYQQETDEPSPWLLSLSCNESSSFSSSNSPSHCLEVIKESTILSSSPLPLPMSPTSWIAFDEHPYAEDQLELDTTIPVLTPQSSPKRTYSVFDTGFVNSPLPAESMFTNGSGYTKRRRSNVMESCDSSEQEVPKSLFENFEQLRNSTQHSKDNKLATIHNHYRLENNSTIGNVKFESTSCSLLSNTKVDDLFGTTVTLRDTETNSSNSSSISEEANARLVDKRFPSTMHIRIGSQDFSVTDKQLQILSILVRTQLGRNSGSSVKYGNLFRPELTDKVLEYGIPFKSIQSREISCKVKLPDRDSYSVDGVSYLGAEPVDNLYDPVFIRRLPSDEDNCGWCEICGLWLQLRNHTYAHHFKSLHGVSQRSKSTVKLPRIIRGEAGDDRKMQGFCELCNSWIDLHHRRDGKRWQTWYIHQFQFHHKDEEPNDNPRPKIEIDEKITGLLCGFLDNCY